MEQSAPKTVSNFLLLAAFLLYLIWQISYVWKKRNIYIKSWNIPGPLAFPYIGILYKFLWRHTPEDIYKIFEEIQANYKCVTKIWFGPKLVYLISKPIHVEKILTSPKALAKDPDIYKHLGFGNSLLTAPVAMWKKHRKFFAPSFSQKNLDLFVEVFVEGGEEMNDDLEKNIGKELDVMTMIDKSNLGILLQHILGPRVWVTLYLMKLSQLSNQPSSGNYGDLLYSRIALPADLRQLPNQQRTGMGLDRDVRNYTENLAAVIDRTFEITFVKLFSILSYLPIPSILMPMHGEMKNLQIEWEHFVDKVLLEKNQKLSERRLSLETQFEDDGKKQVDILGSMFNSPLFTEQEMKDQHRGLIFAGTDTTATALSFVLTLLGIYPEVQQKVYEEILDILGPDRQPQARDLSLMKYTEQVIKESLRIFPSIPFFMRAIAEDLDLGECVLPSGSSVVFISLLLHRNPDVWEEPLRFDPGRFSSENVGKIHQGAYLPFSLGPRNCLGMKYAMMSMKAFLGTVVRKFKFRSDYKSAAEVEIKPSVSLKFKAGTKLFVERREL